jgi:molecular chaperone DnaK (HSP70)
MLEEKFHIRPHGEIDPDLCVALGAAIQAGREMGVEDSSLLLDVTPYTFGTSAFASLDGAPYPYCFIPLIKRNTKLPAVKSEAFETMVENQEAVQINVYQGENQNALENVCIGTFLFKLTKAPAGSIIILNYDLDINGILKLKAIEKKTGKQIEAVIENAFKEFNEEELKEAREKIEQMWGENDAWDGDEESPTDENNSDDEGEKSIPAEILELVSEAKKKLESAPDEDRDQIINLIEDITTLASQGKMEDAQAVKQELEDILFYID